MGDFNLACNKEAIQWLVELMLRAKLRGTLHEWSSFELLYDKRLGIAYTVEQLPAALLDDPSKLFASPDLFLVSSKYMPDCSSFVPPQISDIIPNYVQI